MAGIYKILARRCASRRALTIAMSQTKGGVGKSTSAINIAGAAADMGSQVLLIDADQQKSALSWHRRGGSVKTIELMPKAVPDALKRYSPRYDVIVVDTAGSDSAEQTLIVEAVDLVLCPLDNPWLSSVAAINSVGRARARGTPARIFLSRISGAATDARLARVRGIIEDLVEKEWEKRGWHVDPLFMQSVIRDRVPTADALGAARTVFEGRCAAKAAAEYKALFIEVKELFGGWERMS
ncbi:AAA family ATPase [Jiella sp. M17.18]|uniref:AAA family ATPase n=1 Tax=Jiella sp. M17.18 TaxID=3234247 RepID=UPI0034DDF124